MNAIFCFCFMSHTHTNLSNVSLPLNNMLGIKHANAYELPGKDCKSVVVINEVYYFDCSDYLSERGCLFDLVTICLPARFEEKYYMRSRVCTKLTQEKGLSQFLCASFPLPFLGGVNS